MTKIERFEAFVNELRSLSEKHGIYICGYNSEYWDSDVCMLMEKLRNPTYELDDAPTLDTDHVIKASYGLVTHWNNKYKVIDGQGE